MMYPFEPNLQLESLYGPVTDRVLFQKQTRHKWGLAVLELVEQFI